MRRITIEETRSACQATGYRLKQFITVDHERRRGCPIGVIARARGYYMLPSLSGEAIGLEAFYQAGFAQAWDGYGRLPMWRDMEDYQLGYDDGLEVRRALLPGDGD
jgi:hypothetical protein